jgi:hypothetical protein
MKNPNYLARLSYEETVRLEQQIQRVGIELGKAGLSNKAINRRLQTNLADVHKRKSIACPYEVLRVQSWCKKHLVEAFDQEKDQFLITIGRPQDRVQIGKLLTFDPTNLFRKFRSGIAFLKKLGGRANIRACCVIEVQLTRPLEAPAYYEPHLHAIIQGASKGQLKAAFAVRKSAASFCRNRGLHIRPVSDLEGAIGYVVKITPKMQVQYISDTDSRSRENRMPSECLPEWYRFMSGLSPGDVLKLVGINGRELAKPRTCEMSLGFSESPRRRR